MKFAIRVFKVLIVAFKLIVINIEVAKTVNRFSDFLKVLSTLLHSSPYYHSYNK